MFLCMCPCVKWVNVSVAVVCDRVYITDALHQSTCAAQPEEHLAVICSHNLLLWVHIHGITSLLNVSLCQGREGNRGPCFCSVSFYLIPDLLRWHIFSHTLIEIHKYMCHMMCFFLSVQPHTHTHLQGKTHLNFSSHRSHVLPAVHTRLTLIIGNSHFSPSTG